MGDFHRLAIGPAGKVNKFSLCHYNIMKKIDYIHLNKIKITPA
jgi:hypothetical protein